MTDFLQRLAEQTTQTTAGPEVQPLLAPRFAAVHDLNLLDPLTLRQHLAPPQLPAAAAQRPRIDWPRQLATFEDAALPLPTFQQLGHAAIDPAGAISPMHQHAPDALFAAENEEHDTAPATDAAADTATASTTVVQSAPVDATPVADADNRQRAHHESNRPTVSTPADPPNPARLTDQHVDREPTSATPATRPSSPATQVDAATAAASQRPTTEGTTPPVAPIEAVMVRRPNAEQKSPSAPESVQAPAPDTALSRAVRAAEQPAVTFQQMPAKEEQDTVSPQPAPPLQRAESASTRSTVIANKSTTNPMESVAQRENQGSATAVKQPIENQTSMVDEPSAASVARAPAAGPQTELPHASPAQVVNRARQQSVPHHTTVQRTEADRPSTMEDAAAQAGSAAQPQSDNPQPDVHSRIQSTTASAHPPADIHPVSTPEMHHPGAQVDEEQTVLQRISAGGEANEQSEQSARSATGSAAVESVQPPASQEHPTIPSQPRPQTNAVKDTDINAQVTAAQTPSASVPTSSADVYQVDSQNPAVDHSPPGDMPTRPPIATIDPSVSVDEPQRAINDDGDASLVVAATPTDQTTNAAGAPTDSTIQPITATETGLQGHPARQAAQRAQRGEEEEVLDPTSNPESSASVTHQQRTTDASGPQVANQADASVSIPDAPDKVEVSIVAPIKHAPAAVAQRKLDQSSTDTAQPPLSPQRPVAAPTVHETNRAEVQNASMPGATDKVEVSTVAPIKHALAAVAQRKLDRSSTDTAQLPLSPQQLLAPAVHETSRAEVQPAATRGQPPRPAADRQATRDEPLPTRRAATTTQTERPLGGVQPTMRGTIALQPATDSNANTTDAGAVTATESDQTAFLAPSPQIQPTPLRARGRPPTFPFESFPLADENVRPSDVRRTTADNGEPAPQVAPQQGLSRFTAHQAPTGPTVDQRLTVESPATTTEPAREMPVHVGNGELRSVQRNVVTPAQPPSALQTNPVQPTVTASFQRSTASLFSLEQTLTGEIERQQQVIERPWQPATGQGDQS
ncbi:MAG TPA: hypothetical protein P5121_25115, partial [Caldilineaceae bacterium]|nr:hypothetical protein [Caldilineaceae bacterium]